MKNDEKRTYMYYLHDVLYYINKNDKNRNDKNKNGKKADFIRDLFDCLTNNTFTGIAARTYESYVPVYDPKTKKEQKSTKLRAVPDDALKKICDNRNYQKTIRWLCDHVNCVAAHSEIAQNVDEANFPLPTEGDEVGSARVLSVYVYHLADNIYNKRASAFLFTKLLMIDHACALDVTPIVSGNIKTFVPYEIMAHNAEDTDERTLLSIIEAHPNDHLLLLGDSGVGKSFTLKGYVKQQRIPDSLFLELNGYKRLPEDKPRTVVNEWVLHKVLLQYVLNERYHDDFAVVPENDRKLLYEIEEQFKIMIGSKPEYTLILDGTNEIPDREYNSFLRELQYIIKNWKNVRLILTSKTPFEDIESCFTKNKISYKLYYVEGLSAEAIKGMEIPKYGLLGAEDLLFLRNTMMTMLFMGAGKKDIDEYGFHKGVILDAYFNELKDLNTEDMTFHFMIDFVLPALAFAMMKKNEEALSEHEIRKQNESIYKTFFKGKHDSYLHGLNSQYSFNKLDLPSFYPMLKVIERKCFLGILKDKVFRFSHQMFYEYFAAKYIQLSLTAAQEMDGEEYKRRRDFLWKKQGIAIPWSKEVCVLLGEISKDYKNKHNPEKEENTILTFYLDLLRNIKLKKREDNQINSLQNILNTLSLARNNVICNVDFSYIDFSYVCLYGRKFSDNGKNPSSFRNCIMLPPTIQPFATCITYVKSKKLIAMGLHNNYIVFVDPTSGKIIDEWNMVEVAHSDYEIQKIDFIENEDGEYLIITKADIITALKVINSRIRKRIYDFKLGESQYHQLAVCDDYVLVLTYNRLEILQLSTGEGTIVAKTQNDYEQFVAMTLDDTAYAYAVGVRSIEHDWPNRIRVFGMNHEKIHREILHLKYFYYYDIFRLNVLERRCIFDSVWGLLEIHFSNNWSEILFERIYNHGNTVRFENDNNIVVELNIDPNLLSEENGIVHKSISPQKEYIVSIDGNQNVTLYRVKKDNSVEKIFQDMIEGEMQLDADHRILSFGLSDTELFILGACYFHELYLYDFLTNSAKMFHQWGTIDDFKKVIDVKGCDFEGLKVSDDIKAVLRQLGGKNV